MMYAIKIQIVSKYNNAIYYVLNIIGGIAKEYIKRKVKKL